MSYFIKKLFIRIVATLLLSSAVHAGVSTTGGGFAVVCRNAGNEIVSAEVLDLFEAREVYQYKIMKPTGNLFADYSASVRKTYVLQSDEKFISENWDVYSQWIRPNFEKFKKGVVWLSDASALPKVYDLGRTEARKYLKRGCSIDQVALMEDMPTRIFILKEIWDRLDSVNQAALIRHELLYRMGRSYFILPENTSESIRRDVGLIFATDSFIGIRHGLPEGEEIEGTVHDPSRERADRIDATLYSIFETGTEIKGVPVTRLQFFYLAGRIVLAKTFVDIPQKLNIMDRFPIQGIQFKGWYLVAVRDLGSGIKFQVYAPGGWLVTEID